MKSLRLYEISMTGAGKAIHNSIKAEQAPPAAPAN